jgi:predicted 3-demethylubiquinone-9 3-methyltransferase (glyoxalase superfamily)
MSASITPFLWFQGDADEAADFYLDVCKDGQRGEAMIAGEVGPWAPGTVATREFTINGQRMFAFAGGGDTAFNDAISFSVSCADQPEIDYYWAALLAGGGSEIACGWLKHKFGVRWQIVPANLVALLSHPKAMQAMMGMQKLDIAGLKAAATS